MSFEPAQTLKELRSAPHSSLEEKDLLLLAALLQARLGHFQFKLEAIKQEIYDMNIELNDAVYALDERRRNRL
jgi:hypothetical protein